MKKFEELFDKEILEKRIEEARRRDSYENPIVEFFISGQYGQFLIKRALEVFEDREITEEEYKEDFPIFLDHWEYEVKPLLNEMLNNRLSDSLKEEESLYVGFAYADDSLALFLDKGETV